MTHYDCIPPKTNNKELNMTIDKNRIEIDPKDIQVGDLIRAERGELVQEWRVGINWTAPNEPPNVRYFLLDRPKKIKWAKGTTLYAAEDWSSWFKKGDPLTVDKDYCEDDYYVSIRHPNRARATIGAFRPDSEVTDIKPNPHPRGSERWVTRDHDAAFGKHYARGQKVTIHCNKVYADGASVCVDALGNLLPASLLSGVEIKPEPHPVGATRWVTEDHKSVYGFQLRKGDRVEIVTYGVKWRDFGSEYDVLVRTTEVVYAKSKFLSATPVEPPVFVSVRKDALDKLRAHGDATGWAIDNLLATVNE